MAEVTERDREFYAKHIRRYVQSWVERQYHHTDQEAADEGIEEEAVEALQTYRESYVAEERAARVKAEGERDQQKELVANNSLAHLTIRKRLEIKLGKAEARLREAEGERDEAQRIVGLQQAALDVWKAAHPHEAVPKPHRESMCLEPTLRADIVRLRKDLDRKDHEYAEQKSAAEAAEARLRAVIEAADRLELACASRNRPGIARFESMDAAVANYRRVRDAQPASPEPETSKRADHEFVESKRMRPGCYVCGLPWSQHGEGR